MRRNKSQCKVRAKGFRISKLLKMVFSVKIPCQNEWEELEFSLMKIRLSDTLSSIESE